MTDGRLFADGPGPFDLTPSGVPLDILDGVEDRDTSSSYLRIHADLLDDDAIGDLLADAGAAGLGMWLVLLADAKNARAFGIVSFNAMPFGGRLGASAQEVVEALRAMERAGLVFLRVDGRRCTVRVRRWHRWQSMTDAEKSRLYRARHDRPGSGVARPDIGVARPEVGVNVVAGDTATGDRRQETGDSTTPPIVRASATAGEPVREADDPKAVIAQALGALYPDPDLAARAAQELWSGAFQRKAKFRHGVQPAAIVAGIRDLADHRQRDPSFAPRDVVEYVVGRAAKWNPAAPDLTLQTIENGDPRDRPTFRSDPAVADFDA